MKFLLYPKFNEDRNCKKVSKKAALNYISSKQLAEGIRSKQADPLEEVSFLVNSGEYIGRLVIELD